MYIFEVLVASRRGGEGPLINVFLKVYFDVFRQSSRFNFRPSKQHSFLSPIEIYIPDRVDTSHHLRMNFTFSWGAFNVMVYFTEPHLNIYFGVLLFLCWTGIILHNLSCPFFNFNCFIFIKMKLL